MTENGAPALTLNVPLLDVSARIVLPGWPRLVPLPPELVVAPAPWPLGAPPPSSATHHVAVARPATDADTAPLQSLKRHLALAMYAVPGVIPLLADAESSGDDGEGESDDEAAAVLGALGGAGGRSLWACCGRRPRVLRVLACAAAGGGSGRSRSCGRFWCGRRRARRSGGARCSSAGTRRR